MACHACDGVIEHDDRGIGGIVCDIDKSGDSGVDKGGVTDNGYCLALIFAAHSLVETVKAADGSAHADDAVNRVERSYRAESVAADIADNGDLVFLENIYLGN